MFEDMESGGLRHIWRLWMTARERLRAMLRREPLDRGIYWGEGAWGETRQRWKAEGMAADHDFGFDPTAGAGININYAPPWDTGSIEDEGEHELVRDLYGIIRRIRKDAKNRDVAQYVSFPMSDRASWEELRPRLAADADPPLLTKLIEKTTCPEVVLQTENLSITHFVDDGHVYCVVWLFSACFAGMIAFVITAMITSI